jgi:hypothetical protein
VHHFPISDDGGHTAAKAVVGPVQRLSPLNQFVEQLSGCASTSGDLPPETPSSEMASVTERAASPSPCLFTFSVCKTTSPPSLVQLQLKEVGRPWRYRPICCSAGRPASPVVMHGIGFHETHIHKRCVGVLRHEPLLGGCVLLRCGRARLGVRLP